MKQWLCKHLCKGKPITLEAKFKDGMNSGPQKFADAFDNYAVAITTWDKENPIILAANANHEWMTGYKKEDCVGRTPRMFQGPLTKEDVRKKIREDLANGDYFRGEVINHRPDALPYKVILTIFGVVISGQRYYMVVKCLPQD